MLMQFGLYNPNYFPLNTGVYGVFGFCNPRKARTRPIFWNVLIIRSELMKNFFFHPKTWGKLNLNSWIRKFYDHFCKKKKTRGMWQGGKSNPKIKKKGYMLGPESNTCLARHKQTHVCSSWTILENCSFHF